MLVPLPAWTTALVAVFTHEYVLVYELKFVVPLGVSVSVYTFPETTGSGPACWV